DGLAATDLRRSFDPRGRQRRKVEALTELVQRMLRTSDADRYRFFQANMESADAFAQDARRYRQLFWEETIGRIDEPLLRRNPRTRKVYDEPTWTGYEVVLDVYPDVIAYGILCLPKGITPGEKRPVVVCQHGLEGRPSDTIVR